MARPVEEQTQQLQSLLEEFAPRLAAARELELELDRHLAPRFNAFDYIRTDELGLSRVIADLLDPAGKHGQGTVLLKAMLEAFPPTGDVARGLRPTLVNPVVVRTERRTDTGRFIDITVDVPVGDRSFCLAFENKPYAPQDADQVTCYLRYLSRRYQCRFLLVYLPPSGEGPCDTNLSRQDGKLWENHFRVMPYDGANSLADWFATCRSRSEAERVRAFLKDAEQFCRRLGGDTMTTDRAAHTAKKYLLDNPDHLQTALAVHDAWVLVRDRVCKSFLKQLRKDVEKRIPELGCNDCLVRCDYDGGKYPTLSIYREAWKPYVDPVEYPERRTTIRLEAGPGGPKGWYWGVCSPKPRSKMTACEKKQRDGLKKALLKRGLRLEGGIDDDWPQWEWADRHEDWNPLVPHLHRENEGGGGKVTAYFAEKLLNVAGKAVPAINEVEADWT